MDMKRCIDCKEEKSIDDFYFKVKAKGTRNSRCKPCDGEKNRLYRERHPDRMRAAAERHRRSGKRKEWQLKAAYGITVDEYNEMLASQGDVCAICSRPETAMGNNGKVKSLAVDHDHGTGEIRGLLCNNCNRAIGLLGDSQDVLLSAIRYLQG